MDEPQFLVNDFLLKDFDELKKVILAVQSKPLPYTDKAVFMLDFTNALFNAYVNQKQQGERIQQETAKAEIEKEKLQQAALELEEQTKEKLKVELETRKRELLAKMNSMKRQEERIAAQTQFKEVLDNPVQGNIVENESSQERKDLVVSKVTKSVLVYAVVNDSLYSVVEPVLSEREYSLLDSLKEVSAQNLSDLDSLKGLITESAKKAQVPFSVELVDRLRYYLIRDVVRFGKVSPLLEDKEISEVICEGISKPVRAVYQDKEVTTNIAFDTSEELNSFVEHLAKLSGNLISVENPFLNASFDGLSIQANLSSEFVSGKFVIVRQ